MTTLEDVQDYEARIFSNRAEQRFNAMLYQHKDDMDQILNSNAAVTNQSLEEQKMRLEEQDRRHQEYMRKREEEEKRKQMLHEQQMEEQRLEMKRSRMEHEQRMSEETAFRRQIITRIADAFANFCGGIHQEDHSPSYAQTVQIVELPDDNISPNDQRAESISNGRYSGTTFAWFFWNASMIMLVVTAFISYRIRQRTIEFSM